MIVRLYTCLTLLFYCQGLQARADAVLNLDARSVEYDGQQIILSGNVALDHPLGTLKASKATVVQSKQGDKDPFSHIHLQREVEIELNEGGKLLCDRADLNYLNHTGVIKGANSNRPASFSLPYRTKGGKTVPIKVSGQLVNFDLVPEAHSANHLLSNLVAQGEVKIHYDTQFFAFADRVIYRQSNAECIERAKLPGTLFLLPQSKRGCCELRRANGDEVRASMIRIDSESNTLCFQEPKGKLGFSGTQGMLRDLEFTAKEMTWDEDQSLLTLKGDVEVEAPLLGILHAEDELQLAKDETYDGTALRWLRTQGPTHLELRSLNEETVKHIACYNGLEIDNRRLEIHFQSSGRPDPAEHRRQVCYQDELGQVHADEAIVRYRQEGRSWAVQDILITGNVFVINQGAQKSDSFTPTVQYAKADTLKIIPEEKLMVLSGKQNRVLFFDKTNNVQVSAPAVEMTRNQGTGRDAVKGLGDVRLQFIGKELDQILDEAKQLAEFAPIRKTDSPI